jgi:alkylation response protein AidB-like acyl-CoA dehydrogenase
VDFAFSEEQEMLRQQARSFIADKLPPDRIAALTDSDERWDEKSWREMAELGWIGLSAPEEAGGAGMTFLDEAVLFEELGYGLYPGPYFSTVALALPALEAAPDVLTSVVSGEAAATLAWAEPDGATSLTGNEFSVRARDSGGSWTLHGTKHLVPDLTSASLVVVAASSDGGPGLWAVDAPQGAVTLATMDPTRPFARIEFDGAPATVLVPPGEAADVIETIRVRALAALALEAVGVAQKVLELARDHAKERKQFDRPIGVYQAVAHKIADTYVECELARSLAYWAAWCVAEQEQAALAAPAAKSFAAEAAVSACENCIQVHGGIGFTWEHPAHRYYKRAQWIQAFEGYPSRQRARVADHVLA